MVVLPRSLLISLRGSSRMWVLLFVGHCQAVFHCQLPWQDVWCDYSIVITILTWFSIFDNIKTSCISLTFADVSMSLLMQYAFTFIYIYLMYACWAIRLHTKLCACACRIVKHVRPLWLHRCSLLASSVWLAIAISFYACPHADQYREPACFLLFAARFSPTIRLMVSLIFCQTI